MVVPPLVKLGSLIVKTFCKPVANSLKKEASYQPMFRQLVINLTQINHRVVANIQRRIYGQTTDVAIQPLDEEKAVKTAATLLEIFMFTVAGAAAIFEIQNSIKNSRMKEERHREELQAIKTEVASAVELHAQKQVELLAQKQAKLAQMQEQLQKLAQEQKKVQELAQKQGQLAVELAQKQETLQELAQKQEQLVVELTQKLEKLAAELAQKHEQLAAKLAQQLVVELAEKQDQLAAKLAQKQEHVAAELAAELKEQRQLATFFVIFNAHSWKWR